MKSFALIAVVFFAFSVNSIHAQTTVNDSSFVVDVSNTAPNQDNPSVSINRKNKDLILIGAASDFSDMDANGMLAYSSTDKGHSWSSSRLPLPLDPNLYIYGEPSTTANDAGSFYYGYVTNDGVDSGGSISIASSSDGKIWTNLTTINTNGTNFGHPDGVFITIDNSSASFHYNRIYAVWKQYYSADSLFLKEGVYIVWSDNDGHSWTNPKFLGPSDDYQICRTGKQGEIYVFSSDSSGFGHELFVSTDGGTTFASPSLAFGFNNYPKYSDSAFTMLKGSQGIAAFPYTSFDVDLNSGRIHAVYGDYVGSVASQSYSFSDDKGTSWSPAQFIGLSTQDSADRFDPWVNVDQKTGEASLLYYSSEADPKNITIAPYRLQLKDPLSYQPQQISLPFDPLVVEKTVNSSPYIGDHTMSDAYDSIYASVWTQNRTGFIDGDVFAYVSYPNSAKSYVPPVVIHSARSWLSAPYPNPSTGKNISLRYYVPHATHVTLDIFDEAGKQVRHLTDRSLSEGGSYSQEYNLAILPVGSYIISMITDEGQSSSKLIVTGE